MYLLYYYIHIINVFLLNILKFLFILLKPKYTKSKKNEDVVIPKRKA